MDISELIKSFYEVGILPLTVFLMYVIGWATPADIIKNTFNSQEPGKNIFEIVVILNIILGLTLCSLGGIFAFLDTVLLNNGNIRGYSIISFGIMLLTLGFTLIQVDRNGMFIKKITNSLKLTIKASKEITNFDGFEKQLYYSRIIFLIGGEVCIIGCILFLLDNFPVNVGQFRYIVMISIGFAIMLFGGSFERMTINEIVQSQILKKMNPSD